MEHVLNLFSDLFFVYKLIFYILSFGLFIAALEDLKSWTVFQSSGILSWNVSKFGYKWNSRYFISKMIVFFLSDGFFKVSIYLRLLFSFLLFMCTLMSYISPAILILLLALKGLIALRSPYGLDGAYQMYLVILFSVSIGTFVGVGSKVSEVCLWFIAGELVFSYLISGFSKCISPVWRRQHALNAIFSTRSYGHSFLYRLISPRVFLATIISWFVFLFEILFILVFFSPQELVITFIGIGCLFHLSNAIFMGLNDFVYAFLGAYPALLYCVNYFQNRFVY